jgi:acetolactate synthase-1/2/3 large subunit
MTIQEMGTAAQEGANVIVVVADNGVYGTIRMHQEREYPGRVSGTWLRNPDFAVIAEAYGFHGELVTEDAEFAGAFERARGSGRPALIHVVTSANAIAPGKNLPS